MHEVVGMNVVPARDLGNDRLGRQELPIRSFSANVHRRRGSGPDRKAPSPSSRLPINLQINEQTSHRERDHRLITGAPSSGGYGAAGAGTLIMGVWAPVIMAVLATPVWTMFFKV
jgi:hypothetical protein